MTVKLSDDKITPEVRDMFAKRPAPKTVAVIIAAAEGQANELRRALPRSKQKSGNTDYYVFAHFAEIRKLERFVEQHDEIVEKVWLNKRVKMLTEVAEKTVKAAPARRLFNVEGEGVTWAVLDTGVNFEHVWLDQAESQYGGNYSADNDDADNQGHGTHVAGIVVSMAPQAMIANYKVLDRNGAGSDSNIIEAMHAIRKLNLISRKLVIHGANLSIGGAVPVGSYGIGASPVCQEANRLMRSGVVVCIAAGNSGHQEFLVPSRDENGNPAVGFHDCFLDLSIEDPANAEDVITVGSVHTENPHTYGVSYFSSKGPTGDGRAKPDLVAPGEKIWSADYAENDKQVEMSGTSMATPVVSGVIALLLSRHPELKGETGRIKDLVKATATDLGRDHYFQGAGMIDALRLLQAL
ncbi:MAG: S8 family peptidase [Phycisphaerae bacterium]|jgi:subtilisin family serine protease|nr:S8 family peptidase [Phycisphaerae bacterium]